MPATPASSQYLMAQRMLGGDLSEAMRRLFKETGSWEQVSRDLYAEAGIVITGQTLRRWARILGIIEPAREMAS